MKMRKKGAWKPQSKAKGWRSAPPGLKHKDLVGIPWRVAFALQADGWCVRQEIIWEKSNVMPESVWDRCTRSHEYIFMLTKSHKARLWRAKDTGEWSYDPDHTERLRAPTEDDPNRTVSRWRTFSYFYDADAISEPVAQASLDRWSQNVDAQHGSDRVPGKVNGPMKAVGGPRSVRRGRGPRVHGNRPGRDDGGRACNRPSQVRRNKRSVWTVATESYSGAHYAVFPAELIEPCILAGSRPGDKVLDLFGGSGTTAAVALKYGRRTIVCELNPASLTLIPERIRSMTDAIDQYRLFDHDEQ